MIECGPGFCLHPINTSCIKIEGDIFGKNMFN